MRDTNYRSVTTNRPVVPITSTLYDRRSLDVSSNIPLINSLNHLTYLTSNSAKVRETIANDGALERLVSILHNCQLSKREMLSQRESEDVDDLRSDTLSKNKIKALHAWKWTLAFQCLVLTGTRGTEVIRNKVVSAGVLPLLATVLDNFLLYMKNYDFVNGTYLNFDFKKLDLDSEDTFEIFKKSDSETFNEYLANLIGDDIFHLEGDAENSVEDLLQSTSVKDTDFGSIWKYFEMTENDIKGDESMDNCFLGELPPILRPREFYMGRVVPKQDDVIWSLQLLAFISKYTYIKKPLQAVKLDDRLSFRPIVEKVRRRLLIRKGKTYPIGLINRSEENKEANVDLLSLEIKDIEDEIMMSDDNRSISRASSPPVDENFSMRDDSKEHDPFILELFGIAAKCDELNDQKSKSKPFIIQNPYKNLGFEIDLKPEIDRREKQARLKNTFNTNLKRHELWRELDDDALQKFESRELLNLFPLVEKFTVTGDNQHDVIYWSSVIMRNSCRKNEVTGVRQCANFSCGKWEEYPRQFAKCRRCKRTKYCSRKCQLKAWTYHRYWCHEINPDSKNSTVAVSTGTDTETTTPNETRSNNPMTTSTTIGTNFSNLETTEGGIADLNSPVSNIDVSNVDNEEVQPDSSD